METKRFTLQIFKPGDTVWYQGRPRIVNHISISGNRLWVHLDGEATRVHESMVECIPTLFEVTPKRKLS